MTPTGCWAYVGCRTTAERNARGRGLRVFRIEAADKWTEVQVITGLVNPSYLAAHPTRPFLYAVHGDGETVSAFAIESATGRLTALGDAPSGGRNPVHAAVSPAGNALLVANHDGGTVSVLPILSDGVLAPPTEVQVLGGTAGRVSQPHQIMFVPAGNQVLVPDKGLDVLHVFTLDSTAGRLGVAAHAVPAGPAGTGPRHIVYHPSQPMIYVVNEKASTLTAYRQDGPMAFRLVHTVPARRDPAQGDNRAAGIALSGDGGFVYVSNRGDNDLAIFRIDPLDGRPEPPEFIPTGGASPRFITIMGSHLYVANEGSDNIQTFDLSNRTRPSPIARIKTESPTCVLLRA